MIQQKNDERRKTKDGQPETPLAGERMFPREFCSSQQCSTHSRLSSFVFRLASDHRGFTLIEVLAAGVILAAAMVVTVQILGWVALEHRAAERRQWAVQEVSNVMERLAAQPWEKLSTDNARSIQLSPGVRAVLPSPELRVEVSSQESDSGTKRVTVELKWRNRAGQSDAPVRLTTWIYRHGGMSR